MKTLLLVSCLAATALAAPFQLKKPCGFFPFSPCPAAAGEDARWTPLKKPCGFFPFPLCPAARKEDVIEDRMDVEATENRAEEDVIEVLLEAEDEAHTDEKFEALIVTIDKDVEALVDVEARKEMDVEAIEALEDVEARKEVEVEARIEEEINGGHQ